MKKYERPCLMDLNTQRARGEDCISGSAPSTDFCDVGGTYSEAICTPGSNAADACADGTTASNCSAGTSGA